MIKTLDALLSAFFLFVIVNELFFIDPLFRIEHGHKRISDGSRRRSILIDRHDGDHAWNGHLIH